MPFNNTATLYHRLPVRASLKDLASRTWPSPPSLLVPAVDAPSTKVWFGSGFFPVRRVFLSSLACNSDVIFHICYSSVLLCPEAECLSAGATIPGLPVHSNSKLTTTSRNGIHSKSANKAL